MGSYALVPHPDFPPRAVTKVVVRIASSGDRTLVEYDVEGGAVLHPPHANAGRKDGLWQTTCFELFARIGGGDGYIEFNFSPSTQWAAYQFDGHRAGMRDLATDTPVIEKVGNGVRAACDLPDRAQAPLFLNLTAVIEETDGTKSYWALVHPGGPFDFHDAACFVLELPALG